MHNIHGTSGMTPDPTQAHATNGYNNDPWASISPYSQSPYGNSPLNEFNSWTSYIPHGLTSESLSAMPPPPQTPQQQHPIVQPAPAHMAHHQLPMLTTTWPSQLTNPTPSGSYSAPPLSLTPVTGAQPAETPKPASAAPEKARKTLSAEQKRAMCQYFADNPKTRQADIGAVFGVERSTVSKVLRQKDQYLKRDQESDSAAAKRVKGKHPDFDRTLSNYVRRQQQRGFDIKDEEIMEQARLFAHGSGNSESLMNSLTSSWLQKFKQRHGIGPAKLMRRASDTNIPDSARISTVRPKLKKKPSSGVISPASPTGQMSPRSESRSDDGRPNDGLGLDFTYGAMASQSSTSLSHDAGSAPFSSGPLSPIGGHFTFSPDPDHSAGFAVESRHHLQSSSSGAPDHHGREKRSNTFPSLNIDTIGQTIDAESMTPRQPSSAVSAVSAALESPIRELKPAPFAIDTALAGSPSLRRSSSHSSITGRSNSTPAAAGSGSVESSPVSPSQEDARRAANTLLNYIQSMNSGHFDQTEYLTIVSLTKKLQVHQHSLSKPSVGGLSRIPEGDTEMHISTEVAMKTG